jgi:hypothetical protein
MVLFILQAVGKVSQRYYRKFAMEGDKATFRGPMIVNPRKKLMMGLG